MERSGEMMGRWGAEIRKSGKTFCAFRLFFDRQSAFSLLPFGLLSFLCHLPPPRHLLSLLPSPLSLSHCLSSLPPLHSRDIFNRIRPLLLSVERGSHRVRRDWNSDFQFKIVSHTSPCAQIASTNHRHHLARSLCPSFASLSPLSLSDVSHRIF